MAFDNLVGQVSVKKKLGFYLEAYNSTSKEINVPL